MKLLVNVDGVMRELDTDPGASLLRVLRRLGAWSVKYGCDSGDCGACLVLLDDRPHLACRVPAYRAAERRITTVASLGAPANLNRLQRRFLEHGAAQCGYCTPAMVLAAHALLQRQPRPDVAAVRQALAGVLCRCTGYVKPMEAILAAARDAGRATVEEEAR